MLKLTERHITTYLAGICANKSEVYLPNYKYHTSYEIDFLRITRNGVIIDYEAKTSRSDFHADAGKFKHKCVEQRQWSIYFPQKLIYVTPPGLVEKAEIPDQYGLAYFDGVTMKHVKRAKTLHKKPIPDHLYRGIARRWGARYAFNQWHKFSDSVWVAYLTRDGKDARIVCVGPGKEKMMQEAEKSNKRWHGGRYKVRVKYVSVL